jgi:hypothetical protein
MSQFSDPHNPFAPTPPGHQPPPRKSNALLYILLGGGGALLLVCCGCGGLSWFGWGQMTNVLAQEMQRRLEADPVAQEHLGPISSTTWDFMGSTQETESRGGQNVFVFRVEGEKGRGDVIVEQAAGGQAFRNAVLRLPSGEEHALGF